MFLVNIFIAVISLYIVFHFRKIELLDIILIITALVAMFFYSNSSESHIETFYSSSPVALLPSDKIQIDEDVSDINPSCVMYNTAFNPVSYSIASNPLLWNSLIHQTGQTNHQAMTFSVAPLFSQPNGFYLGNNTIIGPNANQLGIDFLSVYTILLVCKHGNLPNSNQSDIELLKLYATSDTSPNGLTLSIAANSISNVNNVQVGGLQLLYADQPAQQCVVKPEDALINFDVDVLTFYFLVKENTTFKIKVLTELNPSISKVFEYQPNNTNVVFANSGIRINRLGNWNAKIFNFAIFNQGLSDDDITQTYNHIMVEYMKYKDPNFVNIVQTYNNMVDTVGNITKCPFNNTVCNNCQGVHRWYNTNDIMQSSPQCLTSINDYCTTNKNNAWCMCWDTNNTNYNTQHCRLFRGIYGGANSLLDNLSTEELAEIKNKYGLVDNQSCQIVANAQASWKSTKDIQEPSSDDVQVQLPIVDDQIPPPKTKKTIVDYYQKNMLPLNQPGYSLGGTNVAPSTANFDLSGMKVFNDYQDQQIPKNSLISSSSSNNTNNNYFDKFLKVMMPSS